jgi:hypothetical protein
MFVCQNKKIVCHSRTTLLPYPNPHTILRSLIGNYKACFTHKGLSFDNLLCLKTQVSDYFIYRVGTVFSISAHLYTESLCNNNDIDSTVYDE